MTRLHTPDLPGSTKRSPAFACLRCLPFLLPLLLIQAGCALPGSPPDIHVTGIVYGSIAAFQEQGVYRPVPLPGALVACNHASAKTDASGRYSLLLAPGS